MKRVTLLITVAMASSVALSACQQSVELSERNAEIVRAVDAYVMSAYEMAPEKLDGNVHRALQKVGYSYDDGSYRERFMNFSELQELVSRWNRDGRFDPQRSKKTIEVLDALDVTAVAKVEAAWGIDHLQLAKVKGRWQIVNVLWQSYPP